MSKKCQDFIGSVRLSGNSWKQKIDNNFIYIFYVHFIKEFSKSAAVKPRIQWIYFFFSAYLYIHDIWNVLIVTAEVFHLWWYKIWQKMWKEKKVTKKKSEKKT